MFDFFIESCKLLLKPSQISDGTVKDMKDALLGVAAPV